ncbi:MAG: diguanylate cyclase [Gallionellaceae bacterium]
MISKWWRALSIQLKLTLLVQLSIVFVLIFAQNWIMSSFEKKIMESAKVRVEEVADGIINGMNMMMIMGHAIDPQYRAMFIEKMGQSQGIKELRVFRADQVKKQYGEGLAIEQPKDDIDRSVLASGKPYFEKNVTNGHSLRAVIPFIASHNFKGTDCLQCHQVEAGSVNGATSIVLDLSVEARMIDSINQGVWVGQIILQLVLFFVLSVAIRSFTRPVARIEETMTAMERDGNLSRRVDIKGDDEIGRMAHAFNSLAESLQENVEHVKKSKEDLRLSAQVFVNSAEAIVITNAENNIIQVNKAFTDITGYAANEVVGHNPRILQSGQHDADFYKKMWEILLNTGSWQGEIMDRRKSGEIYPKWISMVVVRNERNEISNYIAMFSDITERRASFDRIQYLAHYDALTQLANRVLLNDHIEMAIVGAKRTHAKFAVIFMDLDRFKIVNDQLGHHIGDLLLQAVAERLRSCIRESDTVARLGGDEFVILLNNINDEKDAAGVAQKVIDQIGNVFEISGHEVSIGTSIGISIFPKHGADRQTLLKQADAAMYLAKEKGRNNFQFFPAE